MPGDGWKLRAGSSALTRHSITWPRSGGSSVMLQRLARRDADLLLHEVDAGEHLGDRMLDLDARVHLHEVERAVLVEQHLDRARRRRSRSPSRQRTAASPIRSRSVRRQRRARRFLDQLLVAALHRAVALAQVDDVAVRVAQDLELDVARAREVLLDVDLAVAERRQRLGARELERARELVGVARPRACPCRRRPPPP